MAEIKELNVVLSDEGAYNSNGRSYNVWCFDIYPESLKNYQEDYMKIPHYYYDRKTGKRILDKNKKPPIHTAHDDYIYEQIKKNKKIGYLPRISATFKSCFGKYSAVTENLGMKIAVALDMPTSFNYIVAFDKDKHPEILNNYPSMSDKNRVMPFGIVSIDFLKLKKGKMKKRQVTYKDENGKEILIDSYSDLYGDELIDFDSELNKIGIRDNDLEGRGNLVENWIKLIDIIAKDKLAGCSQGHINKNIDHVHSRLVRSFLLREFLGDCDYTAKNCGLVYNEQEKTLRYAPNFDYGECFNPLVLLRLDFKSKDTITEEFINAQPEDLRLKLKELQKSSQPKTVAELATHYACKTTSERNLRFIMENFPDACQEFFENLDKIVQTGEIDKLVEEYGDMTIKGQPLLNKNEINDFKEYLENRAAHLSNLYVDYLIENNKEIPQVLATIEQ